MAENLEYPRGTEEIRLTARTRWTCLGLMMDEGVDDESALHEVVTALLAERERVAKLRAALGIYADRNRWEATTDSYGDQIGTADMFVEDDHGLLKTDGWEVAQQALREDGEAGGFQDG